MGGREQADGEVSAGAAVMERVGLQFRERLPTRIEASEMLPPGRDGIVLVEPETRGDELPEPLDVGLAETLAAPSRRSARRLRTS